jgi:hypothetical protein
MAPRDESAPWPKRAAILAQRLMPPTSRTSFRRNPTAERAGIDRRAARNARQ